MTYLWPDGLAIQVKTNDLGQPQSLRWQGRKHAISQVINRWVVDDFWWLKRTWRDYYYLTTQSGLLLVIFQDKTSGAWYLHRLYD